MYAIIKPVRPATILSFPSSTEELIFLSDLSDENICYLASLGKYGKPVKVSVNYRSNHFILHGSNSIIGSVSKKHYYLAKEILGSEYRYCNNKLKRLSPLTGLQGNVSAMTLQHLVSFMKNVCAVIEKSPTNVQIKGVKL